MVRDLGRDDLDAAPKLAPDPATAPEANGVEKSEAPAEAVEPKAGVVLPNKEGVEADPKRDPDEELKSDDCEAAAVGVANREDGTEEGAADGVLKRDKPPPEEAEVIAVDVCATAVTPGVAELVVSNPETWVDG